MNKRRGLRQSPWLWGLGLNPGKGFKGGGSITLCVAQTLNQQKGKSKIIRSGILEMLGKIDDD